MSRHGKRRGHFCWACGRNRPNERFSGRGHQRHVCKDCSRLGQDELVFLQAVRDIDQTLDWDGLIRRKRRKSFQRFLSDTNPRIRAYALEVEARDRRLREEFRNMTEQDELDLEALAERFNEKLADPEREPARECIEGELPF